MGFYGSSCSCSHRNWIIDEQYVCKNGPKYHKHLQIFNHIKWLILSEGLSKCCFDFSLVFQGNFTFRSRGSCVHSYPDNYVKNWDKCECIIVHNHNKFHSYPSRTDVMAKSFLPMVIACFRLVQAKCKNKYFHSFSVFVFVAPSILFWSQPN